MSPVKDGPSTVFLEQRIGKTLANTGEGCWCFTRRVRAHLVERVLV